MFRSFTDRIFGGVCGGVAARLPLINAWGVRLIVIALTLLTLGAFAVVYGLLWFVVPQESLVVKRRGAFWWAFFALILIALVSAGWWARLNGYTQTPDGSDLYFPLLGFLVSLIFFTKQLGRSA